MLIAKGVFQKFGLNDTEIRDWFNGPAFLTWSRGQNEYGNKIAGPLPRSWMKSQWALQKQILARYRSLGIVGELPAFQGNVPIAMKTIHADANITKSGDTGWMTSTDPLFAKIADVWMETLIEDFGTDHWYQLDGYFNGGTAPWMELPTPGQATALEPPRAPLPACAWSAELNGSYLKDCPSAGCTHFSTLHAAQVACIADATCGGVTSAARGAAPWQLRRGTEALRSPTAEASYAITNVAACRPADPGPDGPGDALWATRGAAAYMGVNRTDPDAIWSFQGWAFVGWSGEEKASWLKGFTEAVPAGKFVVIDMSTNGDGEWKKWNDAAFWNAEFIWTTLHDFGGTDGLKGNLTRINEIPFPALPAEAAKPTGVVGTGFTPEGIDQNPAYVTRPTPIARARALRRLAAACSKLRATVVVLLRFTHPLLHVRTQVLRIHARRQLPARARERHFGAHRCTLAPALRPRRSGAYRDRGVEPPRRVRLLPGCLCAGRNRSAAFARLLVRLYEPLHTGREALPDVERVGQAHRGGGASVA